MKRIVVYTLTGLLSPLLSLVLLPVYLNQLTPHEYIMLALTNSFWAVFSVFAGCKTDQALRTLYYHYNNSEKQQNDLFVSIVKFQLVLIFAWAVVFLLVGSFVFDALFKTPITFLPYSYLLLLGFLVSSITNLYFILLQNQGKVRLFSAGTISTVILLHVFQLVGVFWFDDGFLGYSLAYLLVNVFTLFVIIGFDYKRFRIPFSKSFLQKSMRFSWPFIPFLILFSVESQLDRFFMDKFSTATELSKYSVVISIGAACITLFNALDNAIRPALYEELAHHKNAKKIQHQLNFYLLSGCVLLGLLALFGLHIDLFLNNKKYTGINDLFPLLSLALLPFVGLRFLGLLIAFENKTKNVLFYYLLKVGLISGLFVLFLPSWGSKGALSVIALSNSIGIALFYSQLTLKIKPSVTTLLVLILVAVSLGLCVILSPGKYVSLILILPILTALFFLIKTFRKNATLISEYK